jgi:hypothetical protein
MDILTYAIKYVKYVNDADPLRYTGVTELGSTDKKRKYTVSPAVVAHNAEIAGAGGTASALARKTGIQNKMAEKLDTIMKHMTEAEIAEASFRDKATAAGILYDKLYRDNHALPHTAIQVNIQTMGMDPGSVEPLKLEIESTKLTETHEDPIP